MITTHRSARSASLAAALCLLALQAANPLQAGSGRAVLDSLTFTTTAIGPSATQQARTDLAAGNFIAMKSGLETYFAQNHTPASDPEAAVLLAIARLASAAENDVPVFLRDKIGASRAAFDLVNGDLSLRFPRTAAYRNAPGFTNVGAFFQYTPEIDLYANPGAQPSISFENKGSTDYVLTLTATRDAAQPPDFDATFYLDGELLGFVNAFQPDHPFQVFAQDSEIAPGAAPDTVAVTLPPGAVLTIGLVYSPGAMRLTPTTALSATILVSNGRVAGINAPRYAAKANFTDVVTEFGRLDSSALAPAIADLSGAGPEFSMVLFPEETGHPENIVLAYADIQLLIAELKFVQATRRLLLPYNVAQKITFSLFDSNTVEQLLANRALLTPRPGKFGPDLADARTLFSEAVNHVFAAGDSGLWTRPAPESGTYLFAFDANDPGSTSEALALETALTQFRDALTAPVPLADLSDDLATDSSLPDDASINLAPLFGPTPLNLRALLPVPATTGSGVIPGGSTRLLGSGLLPGVGTAWWESFLAERGLSAVESPALYAPASIQVQPAASTTVPEGGSATLRVTAESFPPPSFQWYRGSGKTAVPIAGATQSFLKFASADRTNAGGYTVRVTNTIPGKSTTTVISKEARLVVTYAPEIVTPPAGATRLAGRSATFTVVASAVPAPTYQWFLGDAPIANATKASLTVSAKTTAAGSYKVRVTNNRGESTTTPVEFVVHERPRFTTQPVARTVNAGVNVVFTASVAGNPAPTLQWFKDGVALAGETGPSLTLGSNGLPLVNITTLFIANPAPIPDSIPLQYISPKAFSGTLAFPGAPNLSEDPRLRSVRTRSTVKTGATNLGGGYLTGGPTVSMSTVSTPIVVGTYHVVATNITVANNATGTGTQINTLASAKVKLTVKP